MYILWKKKQEEDKEKPREIIVILDGISMISNIDVNSYNLTRVNSEFRKLLFRFSQFDDKRTSREKQQIKHENCVAKIEFYC